MFEIITNFFKASPLPSDIVPDLQKTIAGSPVVVYSKTYCPYCTQTKSLLQNLSVPSQIVELDTVPDGSLLQRGLQELTGQRTVPNIFIHGKHIGGNSDLQQLNQSGELKKLLSSK